MAGAEAVALINHGLSLEQRQVAIDDKLAELITESERGELLCQSDDEAEQQEGIDIARQLEEIAPSISSELNQLSAESNTFIGNVGRYLEENKLWNSDDPQHIRLKELWAQRQ